MRADYRGSINPSTSKPCISESWEMFNTLRLLHLVLRFAEFQGYARRMERAAGAREKVLRPSYLKMEPPAWQRYTGMSWQEWVAKRPKS